ncbi:hypothetical protein CHU00_02190 [Sphingobacterium cellulitidis]|uniref:hypothetical protein n=1 Tax=Sphingobacterium cellulitidis TaxID=1768011 RepID=UPI000B942762|nr:hypothetical protein [Sphingobacterium cellulitidis]OYD47701.1 hypothetical protein CHU00_02190 [Sphingobacterium cellulitidis]
MATVFKSDEMSTGSMGSLLLYTLPKTNLSGFFDFSSGQYLLRDSELAITDFLNVTRSSTAQGRNKTGELITYPVNTPRFHLVESVGRYGLASGDNMNNYFLNSNVPASQSITFAEGTNRRYFMLVRVLGNGSVDVAGVGLEPFTVNGGSEKIIKMTSGTNTITVTKNGNPTYVQVSRVTTPYGLDPTLPLTAGNVVAKIQDVNSLVPSKIAEAYNANGEATVFIKMVKFDGGDNSMAPHTSNQLETIVGSNVTALGGYMGYLNLTSGNKGSITIRKQKGGSVLETSPSVVVDVNKTNVIASRLSKTTASVFFNGLFSKMEGLTSDEVEPFLYRLPSLPNTTSNQLSPNMIICNLIIYDRLLSDAEILEIYNLLK